MSGHVYVCVNSLHACECVCVYAVMSSLFILGSLKPVQHHFAFDGKCCIYDL